jgi:hypothetical protein
MAARVFKYPLTNITRAAEMLKTNMGVSQEELDSPAISINVRRGWNKAGNILAKSSLRVGAEGADSVIFIIPVRKFEKILSCFLKMDSMPKTGEWLILWACQKI